MIALWVFLWWLLGVAAIYAATWRRWSVRSFEHITAGDLIAAVFVPMIWPTVLIAVRDDWMDVTVFDADWFRAERKQDPEDWS